MKRTGFLLLGLCASCAPGTSIIWTEGPGQPDKHAVHEILVCNPPKGLDWDIWGVFDRSYTMPVTVLEGSDATLERYDGVCLRITPLVCKDTLRILYDNRYLNKHCRAPRGFSLKKHGSRRGHALPLEYRFLPVEAAVRDSFKWSKPLLTDMVPSLKKVSVSDSAMVGRQTPSYDYEYDHPEGWYSIDCRPEGIKIVSADESGADYARTTLERLFEDSGDGTLPCLSIEDWPDYPMRAFMLDVGRNYLPKEQVFTIIDILHRYRINTLFLHLTEDEGWSIEIKGLPELTRFGGFHADPVLQSDGSYRMERGLFPSQDGRIGRKKPWGSGTGYYSRKDFKEILRYAAEKGITVIPELDFPGHSSAAIEAMAFRSRKHGDSSYLLTDPADTSKYMAYQGYERNVVDVSLPSTYRFIGKIFDEIIRLYEEAGVPLETINISGDEVAEGCWLGSPSCQALMREKGWTRSEELWSYFLERVIDMLAERHLKFAGYAEVVAGTDGAVLEKMKRNCAFIIVWRPVNELMGMETARRLAKEGFKVVLSNGDYTYMDNAYTNHKEEWGLTWAGPTDELKAWSYTPLYMENVIGIEPMLWGDNVYDFETACYLLFPKVYGMFERCWNARPEEGGFDRFYSVVADKEIPWLESLGINHRELMKICQ